MIVSVDNRDERFRQLGSELQDPPWSVVEHAIRALDGKSRSEVVLSHRGDDDVFLGVYGGDGRYYVAARTDDERSLAVVGLPDADGDVVMMAGGQEVRFPVRLIVDLDAASRAAKTYFESGQLDPELRWEAD